MRQLDEQWVENGRMYKAVLQESKIINRVIDGNICHGCCHVDNWDDDCLHPSKLCPLDKGLIVKDLGPVNEDGLLWCPFCKEFPKGVSKGTEYKNDCEISIFYIEHSCKVIQTTEFTYSEQQSIDAWNWRVM